MRRCLPTIGKAVVQLYAFYVLALDGEDLIIAQDQPGAAPTRPPDGIGAEIYSPRFVRGRHRLCGLSFKVIIS